MSTTTKNLGLFKYDIVADENVPFSITNALNNNWDILDEAVKGGGSSRNVGEIVYSSLPLTDAGLHLLDGALIQGDGIYKGFVDYIAKLYAKSSKKSNVTKIGSLTDDNCVLSGFSTSNYAQLPNSVSLGNNFEICVKVTTGSDVTTKQKIIRINANYTLALGIENDGAFDFNIGDGTQWLNPTNTLQALEANTIYWFKITFNGSRYSLLYSTDGDTFTEGGYLDSTTIIPSELLLIGVGQNTVTPWLGSIDLNESYININGQRWWSGANPSWATDETQWQTSVSTYGVCGKFVYNATDNTVRLPKVTGIIEGTTDVTALGDLVEAGLPVHTHTRGTMNITGTTGNFKTYHQGDGGYWTGAFGGSYTVSGSDAHSYSDSRYAVAVDFNASRSWTGNTSNPIYTNNIQDSTTVQPQTIKCFVYIVIATSAKTDIQVDIDEIATDLNGKVDTANLQEVQCIVETYQNGTSWYRVWSDGWCEQGGRAALNETSTTTITLLKPYISTNYSVLAVSITASTAGDTEAGLQCTPKSLTQITLTAHYINPNSQTACWQACGYIEV